MHVWSNEKDYIKKYRISENKIVITLGNDDIYEVEYTKEKEKELSDKMEAQFKNALTSGKTTKILEKYNKTNNISNKFLCVGSIAITLDMLPFIPPEKEDILVPIILLFLTGGVILKEKAAKWKSAVEEIKMMQLRDDNKELLVNISVNDDILKDYPLIIATKKEGIEPFSIAGLNRSLTSRKDLKNIINSNNDKGYQYIKK